jgi:hypothetical protein
MWWHDAWGGWWFVMPLAMVAFWALVIWLVMNLSRSRRGPLRLEAQARPGLKTSSPSATPAPRSTTTSTATAATPSGTPDACKGQP